VIFTVDLLRSRTAPVAVPDAVARAR